ncbi:Gfo/Idh/MocA family protein [Streptomyces iranensis]|uniref:Dehydrogenase n=1 Tax=Streptomyces iranensis TaxID=576784 RepID=A0A061A4V7_9ACTN|nr:Gfo/Idh/MocA family oxidoreductase [Streptomyces iranensis]MBP2063549.1 putative dehydrogenase [Streptomyces iranensis]CDR17870.1 oxidoreductase domain protein [Streptomyces iranensis]
MTTSAQPLSVAVIGAGMAGRAHAAGYRNVNTVFDAGLPPVRLAAIADANIALGEDAARRYGYEKALPSWEAVAEDPTIDAVSIVVGNALHRPIAEALVAAGKHVLCEKPLAGTLEDARAMAELERGADVVTAVGYTFRRSPAIAAIRDHVLRDELGDLALFSGRYWCDYATDPKGPLSWRFKGGPGSGALGDVGAHVIDTAEYIAGPITAVSGASLSTQIPKRPLPLGAVVGHNAAPVSDELGAVENEDTASFTVRFESGLVGTFSVSRTAFGLPNGLSFDVLGVGGRAAFDQHRPAEYLFDDAQPDARPSGARQIIAGPNLPYFKGGYPMEAPGVGGGNAEMFTYQARAFLDQVAGVAEPLPPCATFADALRTMEIIQAVVESSRRGGTAVDVPPAV